MGLPPEPKWLVAQREIGKCSDGERITIKGEFFNELVDYIDALRRACEEAEKRFDNLAAIFRVNMIRAHPEMPHSEIDAAIDSAMKGKP